MTDLERAPVAPRRFTPKIVGGTNRIPVSGLPALAEQSADPILGVIIQCREAQKIADVMVERSSAVCKEARRRFGERHDEREAYIRSVLGCEEDEYATDVFDVLFDAYDTCVQTAPTTVPGLFAMLIFAAECVDRGDTAVEDKEIFSTFANAAKALSGSVTCA
jgi:hypothetical protein